MEIGVAIIKGGSQVKNEVHTIKLNKGIKVRSNKKRNTKQRRRVYN